MTSSEEVHRFQERKDHYVFRAAEYLRKQPQTFKEFVGDQSIIEFGDNILSHRLSTGYNFATHEQFPVTSNESLILYSVYIQRVLHFGELLAGMEDQGIIQEKDVTFGAKASKILGGCEDPELVISEMTMSDGTAEKTEESVEGVLIFHPGSPLQAIRIARFLLEEAPKVKGGFVVSDTRATATKELEKVLTIGKSAFALAVTNVYEFEKGNIFVLKQRTPFKGDNGGWNAIDTFLNPKLYKYLAQHGVAA